MRNQQLEQALEFAQYQTTFNQQRSQLKQQFENDCVIAYNGGLFRITQEWIGGFDLTSVWALDANGNPISVTNATEFLNLAKDTYRKALINYGESYQELKKKRSVQSLVEL